MMRPTINEVSDCLRKKNLRRRRATTAAEELRNCFFLNTNKIQMASDKDKDSLNTKRSQQKLLELFLKIT